MEPGTVRAYDFLEHTVNVLLVDDETFQLEILKEVLKDIPLCSVQSASSARGAALYLTDQDTHYHVCLCDLGIADIDDDEFYLLRTFSQKTSFVIFTGSDSPAKGFTAKSLGAQALIQKSAEVVEKGLLPIIKNAFFDNMAQPLDRSVHSNQVEMAACILREQFPDTVSFWARMCGYTEDYLRKIWSKTFRCRTKSMVFLFQLYQAAFTYMQDYLSSDEKSFSEATKRLVESDSYRQQSIYFLQNRQIFCNILQKKSAE